MTGATLIAPDAKAVGFLSVREIGHPNGEVLLEAMFEPIHSSGSTFCDGNWTILVWGLLVRV